ncbi:MAG: hypothetical protein ABEJ70_08690 [Halobacteriaceae archaeon]
MKGGGAESEGDARVDDGSGPDRSSGPRPNRRAVLRALGAGAASAGVAVGTARARTAGRGGRESLDRDGAAPFPDADGEVPIRPVPVRGGCDAGVGDAECGNSALGLYGSGGSVGLGQHTYDLTIQGMPVNGLGGLFAAVRLALLPFATIQYVPPPPTGAGPDWGPYQMMVHGSSISLDVMEDLAAPVRRVPDGCDVPTSCQRRWCANVGRTVDGLREHSRVLHRELLDVQARLAGKAFFVTVPSRALEASMRDLLASKITRWLVSEVASLRTAVALTSDPDVDAGCGDCPTCVQVPRLRHVRSWDLRVYERSRARLSMGQAGSSGGIEAWATHELRATARLEPASEVGPRHLGELLGGTLGESVGSVLGFVGGLGAAVGRTLGGAPDHVSWTGQPSSVSAWQSTGHVFETDDGNQSVRHTVTGTRTDFDVDADFATLDVYFDDDAYELDFPTVEFPGTTTATLRNGDVSTSRADDRVGYGNVIARRAQSGGSDPLTVAESRADPVRFSLADSKRCGSQLGSTVELDQNEASVVHGAYLNSLGKVTSAGGGGLRGHASVGWELVPRSFEHTTLHTVGCQ